VAGAFGPRPARLAEHLASVPDRRRSGTQWSTQRPAGPSGRLVEHPTGARQRHPGRGLVDLAGLVDLPERIDYDHVRVNILLTAAVGR